jgi:hypothetical protein
MHLGGFEWMVIMVVVMAVALRFYGMFLRHRQTQLLLEERRALIEQGVTDLPALQLPDEPRRADPFRNLKAGILTLCLAIGLAISYFASPMRPTGHQTPFLGDAHISLTVIAGTVGVALIAIHFLTAALSRD